MLFVSPSPPSRDKVIFVMKGGVFVGDPEIKGNTAQVGVQYLEVGRLDSALRFNFTERDGPVKTRTFYTLILSARHWERGCEGGKAKDVTGPMEWRIAGSQPEPRVTAVTALRYLVQVRDKSMNPTIRENADRSIAILKRLP